MSPQAQPHRTVRALLLAVSTLLVVAVVFAIYTQLRQNPETRAKREVSAPLPPTPSLDSTSQPTAAGAMHVEGVPVARGGRTRINLYGSEGARARLELEVDSFEPVGPEGREFRLARPTIRFRTPAGQLVNVDADSGVVEMHRMRGDNYELARGRLEGHVVVLMDRLDDVQRAALPPEQREELTPDRTISVELEDLVFDLEYSRVESSGWVRATLAEASFEGRKLMLRYDEAASRIEYLKVDEGARIALRGVGGSFNIALPGAGESGEPSRPEANKKPAESETEPEIVASELVEDDGIPLFVPDSPKKPRVRETVTYTAVFERDVVVDQFEGQVRTGLLSADRLAFLFDFGQEQRDIARDLPGAEPGDSDPADTESVAPVADPAEMVLNWAGPLVVDLVRDEGAVPPDVFGKRLHITATGQEVYVAARQGAAWCRRMVYHYENEQAWLLGDEGSPFVLDIAEGPHVSGRELWFDPRDQTVSVAGPGLLSARGDSELTPAVGWGSEPSGEAMSISFTKDMNLCLGVVERELTDAITGDTEVRKRKYVRSAELLGRVLMNQESGSIAAERVAVSFRPPTQSDAREAIIDTFHAEGGVRMVQGDERITCRVIDVAMAENAAGRLVPSRANAVGDVVAAQGQRAIRASERMIVSLESVPVKQPPFDLVLAKVEAVRRGLDPAEIDWDAQRTKYERERKYALGLARIQAYGDVNAYDPMQNLHIDAGELDCSFRDGRTIDGGVVRGHDAMPASVEFGDFGIMAHDIEFDASTQWAEVPDAGRLTFTSRKDLDGRTVDNPIPISVTWAESMRFRGRENTALFTGAVHAVSENSTFDCDELVLDFTDDPVAVAEQSPTPTLSDWWIVRSFLRRAAADDGFRLEAPEFRKQLAYLSANGDVVGLTASYDEETGALKTRARIAGPRLAVDLRRSTQAMTIDDAGTLLIEDYRVRAPAGSGALTKLSPFGAQGANLPSQTFISWERAMSFYSNNRLAVFEKDVELRYRSGVKLMLGDEVLDDDARDGLRESTAGQDAHMMCQQLNVQFLKDGATNSSGSSGGGLGGASGNSVASFAASGGVFLEDSGRSVTCRTITYDRERELLQILGTRDQPAELIDQSGGRYTSYSGPTIYWERDTGRIEAPRSTIRVH